MFSFFAKSPNPEIDGSDIVAIIKAGNLANCAAISYNGLNITYTLKPDRVVADSPFKAPLAPNLDSQETTFDEPALEPPQPYAPDLDTLMLTDPLAYERLIHEEDNAR